MMDLKDINYQPTIEEIKAYIGNEIFKQFLISFFFVSKTYGVIVLFSIFAYPILKNYSGEKGKVTWMKWFFYWYYPLHLILLGILRIMMYGNVPLLF